MVRGKRGPALLEVINKGSTPAFLKKSGTSAQSDHDPAQERLFPEDDGGADDGTASGRSAVPLKDDEAVGRMVKEAEKLAESQGLDVDLEQGDFGHGVFDNSGDKANVVRRGYTAPAVVTKPARSSINVGKAAAGGPTSPGLGIDESEPRDSAALEGGGTAGRAEPPVVAFDGRYLKLSLTTTMAAFVVLTLVALLVATYSWGVSSGRNDVKLAGAAPSDGQTESEFGTGGAEEFESTRVVDSVDALFRGVGTAPVSHEAKVDENRPTKPAVTPEEVAAISGPVNNWVPGYTYIVVQEFSRGNRDDALHAEAFLKERGIEAEVWEVSERSLQLIAKRGFLWKDPDQRAMGEKFWHKIGELGQEYRKATKGRYALEGFPKTLKESHW